MACELYFYTFFVVLYIYFIAYDVQKNTQVNLYK